MADSAASTSQGFRTDRLVFAPDDVDLRRSPLRASVRADTFVLGAFNPGLARLPNGNLVLMVRVAEALRDAIDEEWARAIRWTPQGYVIDAYPRAGVSARDPRTFHLLGHYFKVMALTSLSWLLPVEMSPDGLRIVRIHYDKAIAPAAEYQHYGVEDARISLIDGVYYMTTCSVSAHRQSTTLYTSTDGLNYTLHGVVLDHQNKDMLFFEGRIRGAFWALTRPLGDLYFAYPPDSEFLGGPSINLATSPDALHWRPVAAPLIRARKGAPASARLGGGAQPIRTARGWLILYHAVEAVGEIGVYRTFWALADLADPTRLLCLEDKNPLLQARPDLTAPLAERMYLSDIVFTTGIAEMEDGFIVASGEADLACRVTHVPKAIFGV